VLARPHRLDDADGIYFGDKDVVTKRTKHGKSGLSGKRAVLGLIERGASVCTVHMSKVSAEGVADIVRRNLARESALMTDESRLYAGVGAEFASHRTVNHSAGEYVRDKTIHSNTIGGYFSILKRGMKGIYQHCGEARLHRHLSEFDFRYNTRAKLVVRCRQKIPFRRVSPAPVARRHEPEGRHQPSASCH
jgi:hypothetical protein